MSGSGETTLPTISTTDLTEADVRLLRDAVYGVPSGDMNWIACRAPGGEHGKGWMHPDNVAWLRAHQRDLPYRATPK